MPFKISLCIVSFVSLALVNWSCYSFKGISIPPEINSFQIINFENRAPEAPADLDIRFSEALRTKIRNESKLKYNDTKPDIEFEGEITGYRISSEAPIEGNTVALNKLEITINVKYTNNLDEKDKWTKNYSFFKTFDSTLSLNDVQDPLIKDIFDFLTEKIFNDSFTSW